MGGSEGEEGVLQNNSFTHSLRVKATLLHHHPTVPDDFGMGWQDGPLNYTQILLALFIESSVGVLGSLWSFAARKSLLEVESLKSCKQLNEDARSGTCCIWCCRDP